jgi:hypothetical protein
LPPASRIQSTNYHAISQISKPSTITLISYYNPPKEPLSTQLFQYASNLNRSIILGDFNARPTDFGDTSSNANGKTFSKLISELPIYRVENRNPTHIAGSILDHIVISENLIPHVDPQTFIGTTVTSDHLPLVAQLIRDTPPRTPQPIQIFDYKKADWHKFRREISKTLPHIIPVNSLSLVRAIDLNGRADYLFPNSEYLTTCTNPVFSIILFRIVNSNNSKCPTSSCKNLTLVKVTNKKPVKKWTLLNSAAASKRYLNTKMSSKKPKRKRINAEDAIEAATLQLTNKYNPLIDHPDSDLSDDESLMMNQKKTGRKIESFFVDGTKTK